MKRSQANQVPSKRPSSRKPAKRTVANLAQHYEELLCLRKAVQDLIRASQPGDEVSADHD